MKTHSKLFPVLSIVIIAITAGFYSCKKDSKNTNENSTPSKVFLLTVDSTVYQSSGKTVKHFVYNSSKKLEKINYINPPQTTSYKFDTLTYNNDGTLNKINTFNTLFPTIPTETKTFTYTSGKVTSVAETGTNTNGIYSRTRSFTYSPSGYPSSMTVSYTTGSGTGEPENFTNMVYTNGNITSARLTGIGPVVATADNYPNPYLGMWDSPSNFERVFNKNNLTNAHLDTLTYTIFTDKTFQYSNGRVASYHASDQGGTFDTWLTYREF